MKLLNNYIVKTPRKVKSYTAPVGLFSLVSKNVDSSLTLVLKVWMELSTILYKVINACYIFAVTNPQIY